MICGSALTVLAALAAAIVEEHDVAVFGLAHDVVDDFLRGNLPAAGKLLPIVRVDFLADDQIAHVLRDRKLRDFFGVFRLMIDAVGRAEQNGFHADGAFDQALREVELPANLRFGDFVEIRMRVGVIADLVAFGVFALEDFGILAGLHADHEKCRRALFSL